MYCEAGIRGIGSVGSTRWTVVQPRSAACLQFKCESSSDYQHDTETRSKDEKK
jgi:hypothetical protein